MGNAFWPSKKSVKLHLPDKLKRNYPNLRCTIDCTEIYIERPRDLEIQKQTWSDYKHSNTAKLLIAIAPNGMISFVSRAWGGRISDKQLVRQSGFLEILEPGDVILADRGFPIYDDVIPLKVTLQIPPPSSGIEQQSRSDVWKTKSIANARIHVERAINRLKWFSILKHQLPISLLPLLDDIVTVCAALNNLLLPLVN